MNKDEAIEKLRLSLIAMLDQFAYSAGTFAAQVRCDARDALKATAVLDAVGEKPQQGDPAPTDAGIPISDDTLITDALEIAHDLAVEQQAEISVRYEGYKPGKHAAAARDVDTTKAALAAWQARGQQQAGAADGWREFMEELHTFRSDFYRYQEGDPLFPFSVIRLQIVAMLEEFDKLAAAPSVPGEA